MTPTDALPGLVQELADRQHGHVSIRQLSRAGHLPRNVRRHLTRGAWTDLGGGILRAPGVRRSPVSDIWVAVLDASDHTRTTDLTCAGPLVTGITAAWLRGLVERAPSKPQLLLPHSTHRHGVHLSRPLRTRVWPSSAEQVDGIPVTDPVRMLLDIARLLRDGDDAVSLLRRVATRADGRRLLRCEDLASIFTNPAEHGLPSRLPRSLLRVSGVLANGHSHSALEETGRREIREIARRLGLTASDRPMAVPDEVSPVAEADVAIPLLRFDAEIDGPHHEQPEQQAADIRRDDRMLVIDWVVRRYRTVLVRDDRPRFRRMVEADLRERAGALGIPVLL